MDTQSSSLEKLALNTAEIQSLRDIVLHHLREAIVTGTLAPGQRLKERELSEVMGISTTPIKEALRVLVYEGLVESIPRKGTFVASSINSSLRETCMLRASLEGLAARLAASKITDEQIKLLSKHITRMEKISAKGYSEELETVNHQFHSYIHEFCNNPYIANIISTVSSFEKAFRKRALKYSGEWARGFQDHQLIGEAIMNRDSDLAEERMKAHIERTVNQVLP